MIAKRKSGQAPGKKATTRKAAAKKTARKPAAKKGRTAPAYGGTPSTSSRARATTGGSRTGSGNGGSLEPRLRKLEDLAARQRGADDHWPGPGPGPGPGAYPELVRRISELDDRDLKEILFILAALVFNLMRRSGYNFIARNDVEYGPKYKHRTGLEFDFKRMVKEEDRDLRNLGSWQKLAAELEKVSDRLCEELDDIYGRVMA